MATDTTELANQALAHLGVEESIADLDTETSEAADAVNKFFEQAMKIVQRSFPWSFCTTQPTDLLLRASSPNDQWAYEYAYPSDCMFFRRIWNGLQQDTPKSRVKYRTVKEQVGSASTVTAVTKATECKVTVSSLGDIANGRLVKFAAVGGMTQLNGNTYIASDVDEDAGTFKLKSSTTGEYINSTAYTTYTSAGTATPQKSTKIWTNQASAQGIYTFLVDDVTLWPPDFDLAFTYKLAELICPAVAGVEKSDLKLLMRRYYDAEVGNARGNDYAEQGLDNDPPHSDDITGSRS